MSDRSSSTSRSGCCCSFPAAADPLVGPAVAQRHGDQRAALAMLVRLSSCCSSSRRSLAPSTGAKPSTSPSSATSPIRAQDRQKWADEFVDQAARRARAAQMGDEIARVTVARNARQALPARRRTSLTPSTSARPTARTSPRRCAGDGRHARRLGQPLADRLRRQRDRGRSALSAASAAKAKGIPIDVLPPVQVRQRGDGRAACRAVHRVGQNINLRVLINSQKPARGGCRCWSTASTWTSTLLSRDRRVVDVKAGPGGDRHPDHAPFAGPSGTRRRSCPGGRRLDRGQQPGYGRDVRERRGSRAGRFARRAGGRLALGRARRRWRSSYRSPEMAPKNAVEIASYDAIVLANC